VRTIAANYNQRIKDRFEALGKEDWAYNVHGSWNAVPRTGDEEGYVNYIL
jgi:hypothetical protein